LVALLIATNGGGGVDGMQPLMGGQLSWRVDRGFSLRGIRRVSLTLTTAFIKAPECYYSVGSGPVCDAHPSCASEDAACASAERHGVLCVAQLVPADNGTLAARFWVNDAQCVHDLNREGGGVSALRGGVAGVPSDMVGKWNNFTVRSVHDDPEASSPRRELSRTHVVVGELRHDVVVSDDVVGVLAWFLSQKPYTLNPQP